MATLSTTNPVQLEMLPTTKKRRMKTKQAPVAAQPASKAGSRSGSRKCVIAMALVAIGLVAAACAVVLVVVLPTRSSSGASGASGASGSTSGGTTTTGTGPGASTSPPKTPTNPLVSHALTMVGTSCNILNGAGCNPHQLGYTQSDATGATWPGSNPLTSLDPNAVTVTHMDSFSLSTNGGLITRMESFSSSTSNSFGIGATLPVEGVSFGASYAGKNVYNALYSDTEKTYFARMDAVASRVRVTMDPLMTPKVFDDLAVDMQAVVKQGAASLAWKEFFAKHGTHFVHSITYGGVVSSYSTTTSTQTGTSSSSVHSTNVALHVGFGSFLGASISHGTSRGSATKEQTATWEASSSLEVRGGDNAAAVAISQPGASTQPPVATWLASLSEDNYAVVSTQLAPITELFPAKAQLLAKNMLDSLMRSCPAARDVDGTWTACSGLGYCNFNPSGPDTCHCPPDHQGSTCNVTHVPCSSTCGAGLSRGSCDYSTGKCVCKPNDSGYGGWTGESCDTPCGVWQFGPNPTVSPYRTNPIAAIIDDDYSQPKLEIAGACFCQTLMQNYWEVNVNPRPVALFTGSSNPAAKTAVHGACDTCWDTTSAVRCDGSICSRDSIWGSNMGCPTFTQLSCQMPMASC